VPSRASEGHFSKSDGTDDLYWPRFEVWTSRTRFGPRPNMVFGSRSGNVGEPNLVCGPGPAYQAKPDLRFGPEPLKPELLQSNVILEGSIYSGNKIIHQLRDIIQVLLHLPRPLHRRWSCDTRRLGYGATAMGALITSETRCL